LFHAGTDEAVMVKRVVAMLLGAFAGVVLWYVVDWVRSPAEAEADSVSMENCIRDAYVDCVSDDQAFEAVPEEAPREPVAAPCKDFLSEEAGVAALSACLHEVRRGNDAERIRAFERAQKIATSS
jgi:hypothetical protein